MENKKEIKRPGVGIGIFILNDKNQILFLKRTGSHGEGTWCIPGGHLEWQESFTETSIRETKEETDIDITEPEVVGVTNDIFKEEDKHYVTIFTKVRTWRGEPKIMEPNKATEIGWFDMNKLPSPLFIPNINFFALNLSCLCGSGKKFKECHGK